MPEECFLAFDIGAESGRAIIGWIESSRLKLEEIHRFSNGPIQVGDHLFWDVLYLWSEILESLKLARSRNGDRISSIGVDTWGVDYALLDRNDYLVGNPFHYRDRRTDGMLENGFQLVEKAEIYHQTGIQFMQLNSLFQLLSMKEEADPALEIAQTFLNIPDLFNFWLTGRKASEFTNATTTQCFNPRTNSWAYDLIRSMGLPTRIFQEIIQPGTIYGTLRESLRNECGLNRIPISATASHDTASAIAAIPMNSEKAVFISSGTWSLIGSEIREPVINDNSLKFNFTNEGGAAGRICFLKNISGLWLVQECRRDWRSRGEEYSYDVLTDLASHAEAFNSFVNPSAPAFLSPGGMMERISRYCRDRGQPAPDSVGEFVRAALEGLAFSYREVIGQLEMVLGYRLESIHIVGGGSRNWLLNQFTADATGLPVVAGPVEATAAGNILVQAMALGRIGSLEEGRAIIRESFPLRTFEPGIRECWDENFERWQKHAVDQSK